MLLLCLYIYILKIYLKYYILKKIKLQTYFLNISIDYLLIKKGYLLRASLGIKQISKINVKMC